MCVYLQGWNRCRSYVAFVIDGNCQCGSLEAAQWVRLEANCSRCAPAGHPPSPRPQSALECAASNTGCPQDGQPLAQGCTSVKCSIPHTDGDGAVHTHAF